MLSYGNSICCRSVLIVPCLNSLCQNNNFTLRTAWFVGGLFLLAATIDYHTLWVLGVIFAGCCGQYGLCQFGESSFDVDVCFGRCFHESDAMFTGNLKRQQQQTFQIRKLYFEMSEGKHCIGFRIAYRFATIFGNHSLVRHVTFIAQNHLLHVFVCMLQLQWSPIRVEQQRQKQSKKKNSFSKLRINILFRAMDSFNFTSSIFRNHFTMFSKLFSFVISYTSIMPIAPR